MKTYKIFVSCCIPFFGLNGIAQTHINNNGKNDIEINKTPLNNFIFDKEYTSSEFYSSLWAFNGILTCIYIDEPFQPIHNKNVDLSTVNFRTKLIVELLKNATIQRSLLEPVPHYDGILPLPPWAYWMISPKLTTVENLNYVQDQYGDEVKKDFVRFVTYFSAPMPDKLKQWDSELLHQQDFVPLLTIALQGALSDIYAQNDQLLDSGLKDILNFLSGKYFITQLINKKENKLLEEKMYIFLKNSSNKELKELLENVLIRYGNRPDMILPASFEAVLKGYSLDDLAAMWEKRIRKVYQTKAQESAINQ